MKKTTAAIFVTIFITAQNSQLHSFEVGTHIELSQQAILSSALDDFLKTQLNFPGGVRDRIAGREIRDVIVDGSDREDDDLRFCNHFHNPLRTWDQAGLTLTVPILCETTNESAVTWGQNPAQGFAWQNARDEYFLGLTATAKEEREDHLANTFRALGQLIHLVQDAAQPAHTRNDPHPIVTGFEGYVENVRSEAALGNGQAQTLFNSWINSSVGFNQTILTLSPNPLAPIPIARIIDTTDPEQTSAFPTAGTNQGIAEYSNANFLSWDTIFKDFVFPRVESLGEPFDGTEPVTGKPRRYFPKDFDGDMGYRLVAEGTFWETLVSLSAGDQGYILDRGVFEDYAARLLPRAIGYSAGLIDYFFRGRMLVGGGGLTFSQGKLLVTSLKVTNLASETMVGQFEWHSSTGNQQQRTATWSDITLAPGEFAILCLPGTSSPIGDCIFASDVGAPAPEMPTCPSALPLTVAFSGEMGKETEAVAGKLVEFCLPPVS